MPDFVVLDTIEKAASLDDRAMAAKESKDEAERLIKEFEPFLRSRAAKYCMRNDAHQRDELFSTAMIAFYEAIRNFNIDKGHFFSFANKVVCGRIIDNIRKNYKQDNKTLPLEDEENEQQSPWSAAINETSIHIYEVEQSQKSIADEIEQFKSELDSWGITLESLVEQSPKHKARREECKNVAERVASNPDILQTIQIKRYFPIKAVSEITKIPPKKLERARMFILALLIIKAGDYNYLTDYIK
jgi:RNA polymerase sigma factor